MIGMCEANQAIEQRDLAIGHIPALKRPQSNTTDVRSQHLHPSHAQVARSRKMLHLYSPIRSPNHKKRVLDVHGVHPFWNLLGMYRVLLSEVPVPYCAVP
jgi:hypothetical protein